jgi:hypothetical protein
VHQKPEKMFKIAELSISRPENWVCAHKLVKLVINPAARTIQADVILLDVKDDPKPPNYRELTVESVLADKHTFEVHMNIKFTVPLSLRGICHRKGAQWESESIQWGQGGVVKGIDKGGNIAGRGVNDRKDEIEKVGELLDAEDVDAEGEPEGWTSGPDASQ